MVRFQYKWSVYSSPNEQWLLWDALDERGERERALKAAIKARFDIEEPKQVYDTTGSAYIGKRVKRIFGKKVRFFSILCLTGSIFCVFWFEMNLVSSCAL